MGNAATIHQLKIAMRYKQRALKLLGNKCKRCRTRYQLQFHHIHGRNYHARNLSQRQRYKRYYEETLAGLIKLLCKDCHTLEHKLCPITSAEMLGQKHRQTCYSSTLNQPLEIPD